MNRVCPICRSEYLPWVESCTTCGVAVVDPGDPSDPLSLPEEFQVVYELQSWPSELQALAAEAMAESDVPHGWNGLELVVHVDHEETVDALLDHIEVEHGLPAADADADVPAPLPLPEGDEDVLEYDMADWPDHERTKLTELLSRGGVPHRWEGADTLLILAADEARVEELLDTVEYPDALPPDEDVDDPGDAAAAALLSDLFLAADRLRANALDPDGIAGLVTVIEQADAGHPPYGMGVPLWTSLLEQAEELADLVADPEDRADEAEDEAAALRERLRPYV